MLRRLYASDSRFRPVEFRAGLNILVATTSAKGSTETDSRNGTGKSSMVELLHFALGGQSVRTDLLQSAALRGWVFTLAMDWPGREVLEVARSGKEHGAVWLYEPATKREQKIKLPEWQARIERELFSLPDSHPGLSGRMLLSFLIRRTRSNGFSNVTRSFDRQSDAEATPNLAYLLGLDAGLAARYKELAELKKKRLELRKAVSDPELLGGVVGAVGDLTGQIGVAKAEIVRLRARVDEFTVVPHYEELQQQADELTKRIKELLDRDVVNRRNLELLEAAIVSATDPEVKYLERIYSELGVTLPGAVLRRFEEVKEFHAAVVRNRRGYLEKDLVDTRSALAASAQEREHLGAELSATMKRLSEGGALAGLQSLQTELAKQEARLEQLEERLSTARQLELSSTDVKAKQLELKRQADQDLFERSSRIEAANQLFLDLVHRMYGTSHEGYLKIDATADRLKIIPKIDSDESDGINHIKLFCFDMTLAILAKRGRRGPDFLVHDSPLLDGVDGRQIKQVMEAAIDLTEREGMQYIMTINDDDLEKATSLGFDADPYIIEPRLTDADEDGGLFGFRFDR
jgi:uncharacterized protein YydD (DUF2326 family)